ncbi:hypothetical protein [Agrobacterium rosae]|uniref:hypothetical protein n=1 Tax=Agrobacterium rosae TaxID=1972867 RepID=UPI003B9DF5E9
MDGINWEIVSALANVVMAMTAVIAAWYALRQYRASVRIQELEQIDNIYRSAVDVVVNNPSKEWDFGSMKRVIDYLETQERRIAYGLISARAVEFYRDAASINDDFVDIPADNLKLIRSILQADLRGYRHLIASLQKNPKTAYIVNW